MRNYLVRERARDKAGWARQVHHAFAGLLACVTQRHDGTDAELPIEKDVRYWCRSNHV